MGLTHTTAEGSPRFLLLPTQHPSSRAPLCELLALPKLVHAPGFAEEQQSIPGAAPAARGTFPPHSTSIHPSNPGDERLRG